MSSDRVQHGDHPTDTSTDVAPTAARRARWLLLGTAAACAIVIGAVAAYRSTQERDNARLDAIAPTTTAPPAEATTTSALAASTTTTSASTSTTVPPSTTTRPTSAPIATGAWLVASERGIERVASDGTVTKLLDGPAATIAVASDGTVFFQRRSAQYATSGERITAADTAILAFDRRTGTTRTAVAPDPQHGPDAWLELDGVAVIDGRTQLLVRRWRNDDSKPYEERAWIELVRIDPSNGATSSPITVGIWEMSSTPFSYGGGLLVATFGGEGSRWPAVISTDGTRHDGIGPLQSPQTCVYTAAHCPNALAVSPDGRRLAWIESPHETFHDDAPRDVVVADVVSGNELVRVAVDAGIADTRLQFNGADEVIIISRYYGTATEGPALLASTVSGTIDVRAGTFTRIAVDGSATADTIR